MPHVRRFYDVAVAQLVAIREGGAKPQPYGGIWRHGESYPANIVGCKFRHQVRVLADSVVRQFKLNTARVCGLVNVVTRLQLNLQQASQNI